MPRISRIFRSRICLLLIAGIVVALILLLSSMTKLDEDQKVDNIVNKATYERSNNKLGGDGNDVKDSSGQDRCRDMLVKGFVDTAKDTMTYGQILKLIYEPYGYTYRPVVYEKRKCNTEAKMFPLESKRQSQCDQVFKEWTYTSDSWKKSKLSKGNAPNKIPNHLQEEYSMNGLALMKNHYKNEVPSMLKSKILAPWTKIMIEEHKAYYRAEEFGTLPYLSESAAVFYALEHYKPTGLSGMVIGSQSPWIEAMLLFYGAKQVTTAEYAPLSILHPDIKYVHPIDLAKNWQDYANLDFVVSFSSIEHSGLGRYGDPLDPKGDLREVDKIRCLLKAGGLFYIGLPSGQDQVVFNAHRLYGYIRWPMIAAGFEFLGAFHAKHREIQRTPPRIANNDYKQILFVLKKI